MAIIYTYTNFANDVIALANGTLEMTPELSANLTKKANDLLNQQATKAAYNAQHKKPSAGVSEKTAELMTVIKALLTDTAKTATELAAEIGTGVMPLTVSNAAARIEGVKVMKVVRTVTDKKGLKVEREYTGYYLD